MKLCTYSMLGEAGTGARVGVVDGGRVFEVEGASNVWSVPREGARGRPSGKGHEVEKVRLLAPVQRPGKIIAAIVNTEGMLGGRDVRLARPRLDMKAPSAVIGPGATILAPKAGIRPEVELAAVIGARITRATPEQARIAIMGYTVLNDVTAPKDSRDDAYEAYRRDKKSGRIEKKTLRGPLFRSKNHDTFCPLGPWVVTSDEVKDSKGLKMTTRFDGMLVQDGSTAEYIFTPEQIASYVSGFLTLEPGDVVSCGSVGWTREALAELDPTEFILPSKSGELKLVIEGVGELANPVVVES